MILDLIKELRKKLFGRYARCYTTQEYLGHAVFGMCGGLSGGTSNTEYLSESCVGCPYLYLEKGEAIAYIDDRR